MYIDSLVSLIVGSSCLLFSTCYDVSKSRVKGDLWIIIYVSQGALCTKVLAVSGTTVKSQRAYINSATDGASLGLGYDSYYVIRITRYLHCRTYLASLQGKFITIYVVRIFFGYILAEAVKIIREFTCRGDDEKFY